MIYIIAIIIIVSLVLIYNNLKTLNLQVKNSLSSIDVYLKQRFDLIPNLVEVCKGYANYENNLLNNLTALRSSFNENLKTQDKAYLDGKYLTLLATIENYPELKANEQFLNLQKTLTKIENQLQASRRIYNHDVTKYNTKINIFPFNIFAKIFGFKKEELFKIGESNTNINIQF